LQDRLWRVLTGGARGAHDAGKAWRAKRLRPNKKRTAARAAEDFDTAQINAGEAIDLIRAIEPAGEIVARIIAEAEAALSRRFA
jgi:hypothetical protein